MIVNQINVNDDSGIKMVEVSIDLFNVWSKNVYRLSFANSNLTPLGAPHYFGPTKNKFRSTVIWPNKKLVSPHNDLPPQISEICELLCPHKGDFPPTTWILCGGKITFVGAN